MKTIIVVIVTVVVYTVLMLILLSVLPESDQGRYYDCTIAEFHPDYPPEVKQACRQLIINSKKNYI